MEPMEEVPLSSPAVQSCHVLSACRCNGSSWCEVALVWCSVNPITPNPGQMCAMGGVRGGKFPIASQCRYVARSVGHTSQPSRPTYIGHHYCLHLYNPAPATGAEYCDEHVCVCLSVRELISKTTGPVFTCTENKATIWTCIFGDMLAHGQARTHRDAHHNTPLVASCSVVDSHLRP